MNWGRVNSWRDHTASKNENIILNVPLPYKSDCVEFFSKQSSAVPSQLPPSAENIAYINQGIMHTLEYYWWKVHRWDLRKITFSKEISDIIFRPNNITQTMSCISIIYLGLPKLLNREECFMFQIKSEDLQSCTFAIKNDYILLSIDLEENKWMNP